MKVPEKFSLRTLEFLETSTEQTSSPSCDLVKVLTHLLLTPSQILMSPSFDAVTNMFAFGLYFACNNKCSQCRFSHFFTQCIILPTMGLAYNEFGYNEHLTTTSNIFFQTITLLININVWLQWVPRLIINTYGCDWFLVLVFRITSHETLERVDVI